MAGAGGLLIMLVGALIGIVAALAAGVLLAVGFRKLPPAVGRVLGILVALAAAFAQLLTLPFWILLLSGRGSRGDELSFGEFPWWIYLVALMPPGTLVALGVHLVRSLTVSRRRPPA